jgi:hypothetical protein
VHRPQSLESLAADDVILAPKPSRRASDVSKAAPPLEDDVILAPTPSRRASHVIKTAPSLDDDVILAKPLRRASGVTKTAPPPSAAGGLADDVIILEPRTSPCLSLSSEPDDITKTAPHLDDDVILVPKPSRRASDVIILEPRTSPRLSPSPPGSDPDDVIMVAPSSPPSAHALTRGPKPSPRAPSPENGDILRGDATTRQLAGDVTNRRGGGGSGPSPTLPTAHGRELPAAHDESSGGPRRLSASRTGLFIANPAIPAIPAIPGGTDTRLDGAKTGGPLGEEEATRRSSDTRLGGRGWGGHQQQQSHHHPDKSSSSPAPSPRGAWSNSGNDTSGSQDGQ